MNWLIYSLISTIGFVGIALIIKRLTQFEIKAEVLNLYFWGLTTLTFLSYALIKKSVLKVPDNSWTWFILLAIIAFVTNLFSVLAIKTAPNPGYTRAIQAAQIILVTIASFFLFGSKFDLKTFFGILIVFLGVFLITASES
jgi:drug/metabolite transporter (DMT)-like permease